MVLQKEHRCSSARLTVWMPAGASSRTVSDPGFMLAQIGPFVAVGSLAHVDASA